MRLSDQRERAVGPHRQRHRDLEERDADRYIDDTESAKELDEAEERDEERDDIDGPAGRRQLEREGDEDLAEAQRRAPPPRQRRELFLVEPAREEVVRVPRVVREEPLEILAREIARVGMEPLAGAVGRACRDGEEGGGDVVDAIDQSIRAGRDVSQGRRSCPGATRC